MLDAFAAELHQEFLDLAGAARGFLVQGDADAAIRRGHGLGGEAGVLALDVEVADLPEIEQPLVERRPVGHAAAVHVVREVVHHLQADAARMPVHAREEGEVDVVDGLAVLEAVDQVQRRAADALDRRQAQLHRPGRDVDGLRAQFQRPVVCLVGVLHAEGQAAGRGPVLRREIGGFALGFAIDDEVDVALAVQENVLGPVAGHQLEAQLLEQRFQLLGVGEANSTNSNPMSPMGLSNRSAMQSSCAEKKGRRKRVLPRTRRFRQAEARRTRPARCARGGRP